MMNFTTNLVSGATGALTLVLVETGKLQAWVDAIMAWVSAVT